MAPQSVFGGGRTTVTNLGVIVAVRGSVVDIRFEERLPPIHSVLLTGPDRKIIIEVLAQQDERHVRGIALTPTQGLARGMAVEDTGGPLKAPLGDAVPAGLCRGMGVIPRR